MTFLCTIVWIKAKSKAKHLSLKSHQFDFEFLVKEQTVHLSG